MLTYLLIASGIGYGYGMRFWSERLADDFSPYEYTIGWKNVAISFLWPLFIFILILAFPVIVGKRWWELYQWRRLQMKRWDASSWKECCAKMDADLGKSFAKE